MVRRAPGAPASRIRATTAVEEAGNSKLELRAVRSTTKGAPTFHIARRGSNPSEYTNTSTIWSPPPRSCKRPSADTRYVSSTRRRSESRFTTDSTSTIAPASGFPASPTPSGAAEQQDRTGIQRGQLRPEALALGTIEKWRPPASGSKASNIQPPSSDYGIPEVRGGDPGAQRGEPLPPK